MISLDLAGAFTGKGLEFEKNITIEVNDGIITDVYERRNRGTDLIAMPTLVNSHMHTGDYAFPEAGNWLGIEELVAPPNGLKHMLLKDTGIETIRKARVEALELSWASGVAAVADFVEGNPDEARVPAAPKHIILGRPGNWFGRMDGLGLPDVISYNMDVLRKIPMEFGNMPILAHVSETRQLHEINDFKIAMDALPLTAIVHGTHLTREEIRELAERRVGAVLCPRSNAWFSVGNPDIASMLDENVLLALGTDNAGWLKPDIWREIEAAALLLRSQKPAFNDPVEIIKMATLNPLKIFGLEDKSISKGNRASFMLINSRSIAIERSRDVAWSVIKRVGPESISKIVVG
ncbi:MAG: amidohydrolase family protein [Nitrososphaerota archaeon]|jgi:cytosine/adenosine deaminase-related metal-dependent hydrolase|nr:amidohydrolase family protein [Nitrososphaerota archaeon]MDG7040691.1 amidohydrolase family protein [Nitrososphaerota archaeon]